MSLGLLALAAFLPVPAQGTDWWDASWKYRRKITLKSNLDGTLEAGYPVAVLLDAKYLGLDDKAREGLADLALLRGKKPIPFSLLEGPSKGTYLLWFRTAGALAGDEEDGAYAVYYGNPGAESRSRPLNAVYEVHEDFEKPGALGERLVPERDLECAVRDGVLAIRDVSARRSRFAPGRLMLKIPPPAGGFALSFDLEIDAPDGMAMEFAVNVILKEPRKDAPDVRKEVAPLLANLGSADFEVREEATGALLKLGRPAVPYLMEATRSEDPEVKWRAEHVLRKLQDTALPPRIAAGVRVGAPQAGPIALWSVIRTNVSNARYTGDKPVKVRVTVRRDQDGDVTLLWDNGKPQVGSLPGEIDRILFTVHKGVSGAMGEVRIDNLTLQRHVDDDSRPTTTLDVEESRP